MVSTLRLEQEPVEIPPERAEPVLRRFCPVGVFLGIGAASYASIDFDLVLPTHSQPGGWWTLGGVVAVLTLIGFMSEYGFWKVAAWVVGVRRAPRLMTDLTFLPRFNCSPRAPP
jgi:hypothetical protein